MERLCPKCKKMIQVNEVDLHTATFNKFYPFINMKHVYQTKYYQCPVCNNLCEGKTCEICENKGKKMEALCK